MISGNRQFAGHLSGRVEHGQKGGQPHGVPNKLPGGAWVERGEPHGVPNKLPG